MTLLSCSEGVTVSGDLCTADEVGDTPFHMAAFEQTPGVVKTFLEGGADPYRKDRLGSWKDAS